MYKGVKIYGALKSHDNYGDSIYELVGKWKSKAKKKMHRALRNRFKREAKLYN